MKGQTGMKKKRATAADGKAAMSAEFLSAIDAASGKGTGARTLWGKLIEVLPQLVEATAEGGAENESTKTVSNCALERAHRFLGGKFSKRELDAIGIETVYKIMLRFFSELQTANEVYDFYEYFSAWEYPDLRAVLEARRHGRVKVCGEGVDVAVKLWELEDSLPYARDNAEREETQRQIDEYKTRLRNLGEEIYETLKRGERRAAQAGQFTLDRFNDAKSAALAYGKPDMKQRQRERSAQWLIAERAAGRKASIVDAARHFGNAIEAEKGKGGYADADSLQTALNKKAKELGIAQYKTSKAGRPRKA